MKHLGPNDERDQVMDIVLGAFLGIAILVLLLASILYIYGDL